MLGEHERRFALFGSEVRLLVGESVDADAPEPGLVATGIEAFLRLLHQRLSRFEPASELSRLNADSRPAVPVSALLAYAIEAALGAADRTGGLVDPTLIEALEQSGYERSRAGRRPGPLVAALAAAPAPRPAASSRRGAWRQVFVDHEANVIHRPPGVRLDLGGTGKGMAADLAARRLAGQATFAVDLGGDVRIGGARPEPRLIEVDHPLADEAAASFELVAGAVATSGLRTRVWQRGDGYAHHLIDPFTGTPAWTGVVQATALAGTALKAETLAKAALLSGPEAGQRLLAPGGGVLVLADGEVEVIGPALETALA
jgi:thiamine biosynthesis lipoprotein